MTRRKTPEIKIGDVTIGADNPIAIQSMTNTDTADVDATVAQIRRLEDEGCDIIRCAVYDMKCAEAIKKIKEQINIPLVADVHFDYRLAIAAVENGVDKLRINPGNINNEEHVKLLCDCVKAHNIPIRIGVNSGSVTEENRKKYGGVTPEGIVESAMSHVRILERNSFYNTVISVKVSNVQDMIASYEQIAKICDYPLHLGVTEAGTPDIGTVKNAVGIGYLLLQGIGDTIRVSLTGDPAEEVHAAKNILRSVGLYHKGIEIISCPTCARTRIPLERIVQEVNAKTKHITKPLRVSIMGCVVNGPGEAKDADIGLAGGDGKGAIFKKGQLLRTVEEPNMVTELVKEIEKMANEQNLG